MDLSGDLEDGSHLLETEDGRGPDDPAERPQQVLTARSRPSVNGEDHPVCVND